MIIERNHSEEQYLDLLQKILDNGIEKGDRTGTGMLELFGPQMEFDLSKGFPLLTTKKMFLKGIIHELIWFLGGDTNIKYLNDNGVHIWDEWADENGNLGPIYGSQWRNWGGVDQISNLINEIKNSSDSRRMIVSAWNVREIPNMKLPPCHCLFQMNVQNNKLHCKLYQRSADMFLGIPFNIASYALLTMMIAQVCNLSPGKFIHSLGSAHIYLNHLTQVKQQLGREPYPMPTMKINPEVKDIKDFKFEDFELQNYKCQSRIKAPIAV